MSETIKVVGAREHNLKNVTIEVPKNRLVAFTGVSGSGKSSLVFGTIYAEAQRQLLETFDAYARSRMPKMARPKVDSISDLPVAIVIDQKRLGGNSSSTVGTVTEIYNHMRLLFSRCGVPAIGDSVKFSFNRPEGMCPECKGSGKRLILNEDALIDRELSLNEGAIRHPRYQKGHWSLDSIVATGIFDPDKKLKDYSRAELDTLFYSDRRKSVNKTKDRPFNVSFTGVATMLRKHVPLDGADGADGVDDAEDEARDERAEGASKYFEMSECPSCHGSRLNEEARSVKVGGKTIHELCAMELGDLDEFLRKLPASMDRIGASIADSIVTRICSRLAQMIEIGIGYLSIDRPTATLSGGESQRVKMSRQLDCDLTGLVYILDEPSIGLHPSDVMNLISIMRRLRDRGNTVIVIEHDSEIIRSSDHVIDVGPGGGSFGGRIVFEGDVESLERSDTLTGTYLARKGELAGEGNRALCSRPPKGYFELRNVSANNLKNVSVRIPRGVLTCVTGVAGSGKSSLINGAFRARYPEAVVIDQSAVSRSRRSTPASYTKVLDLIRKEFAKATGADAGMFSFNSIGACPACNGLGEIEIEMHFLESISVPCERCKGKRFKDEVLELRMNGLNIAEVLDSTIDDAITFFRSGEIVRRLKILSDTGLGYLTLGQNLSSLSGGEAQRVKLGSELRKSGNVYIMDEPTTGLHMADIARLSRLIDRLVEAGNSVIVIEHNLEIISEADWIIDLGPCGGSRGGRIVAQGTPQELCASKSSLTGKFLREYLGKSPAVSSYSASSIPHQARSVCSG